MKEIELLKIIFKNSPDILEPLNEIDKEIERLQSIIKEVREFIKEKYIEDYSNNDNYIPLENLNLKNCNWERSLQVLEILNKVGEE